MEDFKGYRGSPNLKRSNVQINWTPELLQEMKMCSQDPIYFAEHHMKVVHVDRGLITISLYDYQKEIIETVLNNRYTVAECSRQSGKALPLDTPIPTPCGWKRMGDLITGDELFDENGKVTRILSTSKIFENHTCYRITFDDGSTVDADAEHLWVVYRASANIRSIKKHKLTTEELFESEFVKEDSRGNFVSRWKIPVAGPAQYPSREITIDPYTLGLWLGDGSAANGRLTASHDDRNFYENEIPYNLSHNHTKRDLYTGTIYNLSPLLRSYNLVNNKHIPQSYLFNSVDVRLELLKGLMDSDGTVEKNGRLCLALSYSKYPKLLEDAYDILVSLGIKVTRKEYPKTNSCRLYFQCPRDKMEVFKLPRKLEKQPKTQRRFDRTNCRYIRNIEKISSVPTRCIEVANESHLFLCSRHYIPTHNTTSMCVFVLWYIIFTKNVTVAILANKAETAREILSRIQLAYEHLPKWLQQGVVEWNKGSFVLENGSRVIASATSSNNIRGFVINLLVIDEAAFIEGWDEFFTSVLPTISSGTSTKVVLVSTVNGLNHFHKITTLARKKENGYKIISVPWQNVPGRDQKWQKETLAGMNFNHDKFAQEYENRYLGSSGTLISGAKLESLVSEVPVVSTEGLNQYFRPKVGHTYVLMADVSRGKGLDYSAIQVLDVTQMPYKQVLTYKDNTTGPGDFAEIINRIGRQYNTAWVLVEVNDIGQQVAETLYQEYEYENMMLTESAGSRGKKITLAYNGNGTDRGVRTTKLVKSIGCSMLKLLVEQDQLLIHDHDTIEELSRFSKKGNSYEAEEGYHDDLTMCLVLFSWLTEQSFFKDLTDIHTLLKLKEKSAEQVENDLLPFGFIADGSEEHEEFTSTKDKDNWMVVDVNWSWE